MHLHILNQHEGVLASSNTEKNCATRVQKLQPIKSLLFTNAHLQPASIQISWWEEHVCKNISPDDAIWNAQLQDLMFFRKASASSDFHRHSL